VKKLSAFYNHFAESPIFLSGDNFELSTFSSEAAEEALVRQQVAGRWYLLAHSSLLVASPVAILT